MRATRASQPDTRETIFTMTPAADLVFVGGAVHTCDAARSRAGAVAVRAGRIVAIGSAEVRALTGPRTEVVDLAGGLLIPGFVDAHVHPIQGGLELGACHLSEVKTEEEYLILIRAYADTNPDVDWITGGGWSMEAFPGGLPDRRELDAAVPDRPVFLPNADHHGAWVNTRALALAGITRDTPDPADGRIERDESGEPTGMLQEGAASLVSRLIPAPDREILTAALLRAQALLHSYGITAWQDALVGGALGADGFDIYLDAAATGRLTARVQGALWWDRDVGAEQIDALRARRQRARENGGRFEATRVKIMLDGVAENHTAAMLSPYLDPCGHPTTNAGLSFIDPVALREHVTALDRLGFSVHFHALGDRAVREGLDAIRAARTANGWSDTRHCLAHLQVVHPDDIPRFRQLGAVANIQPLWACHEPQMDELTIPFLGATRASHQYPFASLLRAGVTLAGGSDWPVSSANPIDGIHVAINRILPGEQHPPFLPEQRIDLGAALAAYTAGSAWTNGLDQAGVIRLGADADLAVLDRDPFTLAPDEIADTRVTQTFVAGQRVHAAR